MTSIYLLSFMAKSKLLAVVIISALLILATSPENCSATVYTVGDSAGWDISADLSDWPTAKIFEIGDVLLFQYSQYHTVNEVDKRSYDNCNTSNAISSHSDGNTSIPLTSGGDRYFVCGALAHCLGGMKLHVVVEQAPSNSPSPAPQSSTPSATGVVNGTGETDLPPFSSVFSRAQRGSAVLGGLGVVWGLVYVLVCG